MCQKAKSLFKFQLKNICLVILSIALFSLYNGGAREG